MPFHFEHPQMLWLLLLIPLVWFLSLSQLRMLGRWRAAMATFLRTIVLLLVITTLAGIEYVSTSDRVAVMFLLDQSDSVEPAMRQQMVELVDQLIEERRNKRREDLAGVIAFGRNAAVAVPAIVESLPRRAGLESVRFDTTATNLEEAIRLAKVSFPAGAKRRIVVVTDGNETIGNALRASRDASNEGIGLDVIPIEPPPQADIVVEKVDLPRYSRIGDPFEARVIVNWRNGLDAGAPEAITGDLLLTRTSRGSRQLVDQKVVEVRPGTNVYSFKQEIEDPASFVYEATFTPRDATSERYDENNRAAGYLVISGQRRALLIGQPEALTTWEWLVEACREESIQVDVEPMTATFKNLSDLQGYDLVILADVPRYRYGDDTLPPTLSDEQINALVTNTEELGSGLLMLGGQDSFGAGGWADTPLEDAMPVNFNVDSLQRESRAAIMMVIDSSGSMNGDKIELSKRAARDSILAMSPTDYIGVLSFDSTVHEIVPIQTAGNRANIARLIQRIQPGGGTDLYKGMKQAFDELQKIEAINKHMLILTDGHTDPSGITQLANMCKDEGITLTSLAVGQDADRVMMQDLASIGGGRYFRVDTPQQIPRILLRETKRISLPLIYETEDMIAPIVDSSHPIIRGRSSFPPIRGYVLTQLKQNPLAQSILSASRPIAGKYPLIASWQNGLGRAAVLTTDGGQRWAENWTSSPEEIELYTRLIRWAMRPLSNSQNVQLSSRYADGSIEISATIVDDDRNYRNLSNVKGTMISPAGEAIDVVLDQIAPGRYATRIPAEREGVYLLSILAEPGASPITTGVTVPFGREFRAQETNTALLHQMTSLRVNGGGTGELTPAISLDSILDEFDPFRNELPVDSTFQNIRPWTLFATCCLFLCDIFLRRVAQNFDWLNRFRRKPKAQQETTSESARLSALERAKRRARMDSRPKNFQYDAQSSSRKESRSEVQSDFEQAVRASNSQPKPDTSSQKSAPSEPEVSYTDRLLAAKRRAREGRKD